MAEAAWSVTAAGQGGVLVDESGSVGATGRSLRGRACPATLELGRHPDLLGYKHHPTGEDTRAHVVPLLGQTRQREERETYNIATYVDINMYRTIMPIDSTIQS